MYLNKYIHRLDLKKTKITIKLENQPLGPSKSEPPSKTIPNRTGIVKKLVLFSPFMANNEKHCFVENVEILLKI